MSDFLDALEKAGGGEGLDRFCDKHGSGAFDEILDDLASLNMLELNDAQGADDRPRTPSTGTVVLNVAHDCNLRCPYCFAKQGNYGLPKTMMSPEMAEKAVDWLIARAGDRKTVRIKFFGGEPLMNMPAIRRTVDYANKRADEEHKKVNYHITTNGTLLRDETIEYLRDHSVDVQVSVDGTQQAHDLVRIFPSGRGSHDVVTNRVGRLRELTGKCVTRATIAPTHPNFSDSVWHLIDDLGSSNAAFEPASGFACGGKSLGEQEIEIIKKDWDLVAEEFLARVRRGEVPPVANILKLLSKIHKRQKTIYGCGAGSAYLAIDPGGDIYPCHRFVGDSNWKMGNILEETFEDSIRQRFVYNTVESKEPCRSCWVRYTCGGRCAHEALEATGDMGKPDPLRCDLQIRLTELCLKLYVRLTPEEIERILSHSWQAQPLVQLKSQSERGAHKISENPFQS
jgi:uncharacterized protein